VRAPDLAFVRLERVKALESTRGFFPGSPDLAIEVLSPSDSFSEVEEKVLDWLGAGCLAAVLLDPRRRRASLYRGASDVQILAHSEHLNLDFVVPGFSVELAALFE
jgi:Uma2 family endonuclease